MVFLLKIMSYFLESERLYFREIRESDLNENYYAWMNDSEINRNMETRFYPNSLEGIYNYWVEHHEKKDEPWFAICLKETDEHVGNIKLGIINWIHRFADISLFIGKKDLWGQGLGQEAITLICHYAFNILNLHKVKAGIYNTNQASFDAFLKAGFEVESILKDQYWQDGKYVDCFLVSKVNI